VRGEAVNRRAPLLAGALALLGCEPVVQVGGGFELLIDVPAEPVRAVDLLFVVDNSNSMQGEQDDLAATMEAFVQALAAMPGGPPDLHIGVTSSDLGTAPYASEGCEDEGDAGRLLVGRGACPAVDGRFLVDVAGPDGRAINYPPGRMGETLACMARLGIEGCGFEQPLAAVRRALDGSIPENAGFLRERALLAVFFVTDEDDCSAFDPRLYDPGQDNRGDPLGELASFRCFEFGIDCQDSGDPRALGPRRGCKPAEDSRFLIPVDDLARFLLRIKRSPSLLLVGGIFGDPEPVAVEEREGELALTDVCPAEPVSAAPAIRLHALASAFPAKEPASLCIPDPSARTNALSTSIAAALKATHCLRRKPLDADPDRAGLQPACRAYRVSDGERAELGTYSIEPDPEACAFTGSDLALRVQEQLSDGERVQLECLAEPAGGPGVPVD
jgi:hypothetical protein